MNNSYWINSVDFEQFPKLTKDLDADVCIVGGGITGLSTAYYLCRNGYNVCLLEKDKLAHHTTRKYNCKNHFTAWTFLLLFNKYFWNRFCKKLFTSKRKCY